MNYQNTCRWRLKLVGTSPVNVFLEFALTPEMCRYLDEIDVKYFPTIGVFEFKRPEDITCFRLKFEV